MWISNDRIRATYVSACCEKSQAEIKKSLAKYGATAFAFAETLDKAMVQFDIKGKRVKFILPLITGDEQVKKHGKYVPMNQKEKDQKIRSLWRSLNLCIKAKLECVSVGITTLEQEFLAHIVLPNGQTFGDFAIPQIEESYQSKTLPPLIGYN